MRSAGIESPFSYWLNRARVNPRISSHLLMSEFTLPTKLFQNLIGGHAYLA